MLKVLKLSHQVAGFLAHIAQETTGGYSVESIKTLPPGCRFPGSHCSGDNRRL